MPSRFNIYIATVAVRKFHNFINHIISIRIHREIRTKFTCFFQAGINHIK